MNSQENTHIIYVPDMDDFKKLEAYKAFERGSGYINKYGPQLCKKMNFIINIKITRGKELSPIYFHIDLRNKPGAMNPGKSTKADAQVETSDPVLKLMMEKKLRGTHAVLQRKVILKGSPLAILRFRSHLTLLKPKL